MDLATTRRNLRSGATPAPTAATRPHPTRPAVPVHGTKGPRMSTPPLVFMDTETTGLSLADDIWEFAAIRRELADSAY